MGKIVIDHNFIHFSSTGASWNSAVVHAAVGPSSSEPRDWEGKSETPISLQTVSWMRPPEPHQNDEGWRGGALIGPEWETPTTLDERCVVSSGSVFFRFFRLSPRRNSHFAVKGPLFEFTLLLVESRYVTPRMRCQHYSTRRRYSRFLRHILPF